VWHSAIEEEREHQLTNEDSRLSASDCSSAGDSGSAEFQAFLQSKLVEKQMTSTRAWVRSSKLEYNVQKKKKKTQ
jgi:hypothetical protein